MSFWISFDKTVYRMCVGIDVATQRKNKSQFYDDLLEQRRTQTQKEMEEQRLLKLKQKEEKVCSSLIGCLTACVGMYSSMHMATVLTETAHTSGSTLI